jgi:hypothetical protein
VVTIFVQFAQKQSTTPVTPSKIDEKETKAIILKSNNKEKPKIPSVLLIRASSLLQNEDKSGWDSSSQKAQTTLWTYVKPVLENLSPTTTVIRSIPKQNLSLIPRLDRKETKKIIALQPNCKKKLISAPLSFMRAVSPLRDEDKYQQDTI